MDESFLPASPHIPVTQQARMCCTAGLRRPCLPIMPSIGFVNVHLSRGGHKTGGGLEQKAGGYHCEYVITFCLNLQGLIMSTDCR